MLTLPADRETEVAKCEMCRAEKRVFVDTGDDGLFCFACIEAHAWRCDDCGDDVVTVVADTEDGPELRCGKCRQHVEPTRCDGCEEHIERGDIAARDEDTRAAWCSSCADGDCRSCGGSGGGDYAGIRCLVCRGTGRRR